MTSFDVVLVPFPFTDLSTTKKRPCLVLATVKPPRLPQLVVVAMMTSNLDGMRFPHDVIVQEWEAGGLPKPTLVRLCKLVSLERKMITKKLGELAVVDRKRVKTEIRKMLAGVI